MSDFTHFLTLKTQWEAETTHLSSSTDIFAHPAYQQIIDMGPVAVPLILATIKEKPGHWFWALQHITGEDPVLPEHKGDIVKMTNDWLKWGEEHQKRYSSIMENLVSSAYNYALKTIKGRWIEGEFLISHSPMWSYIYAVNIIRDRWIEGEDTIAQDPEWAYKYALKFIKGGWTKGETTISTHPAWSYYYSRNVIRDRWYKGEDTISKNPLWAYMYACNVIKGRWHKGESSIAKNPMWAFYYIAHVVKDRWLKGEETIKKHPDWAKLYHKLLQDLQNKNQWRSTDV